MKTTLSLLTSALLAYDGACGATIAINFDTDAKGLPITAPSGFMDTKHLAELYAVLGVHFSGPRGGNDGGAILNQAGNFGVNARSGVNFLAFNRSAEAMMIDGGIPRDPERITFDTLMSDISIFVAGGGTGRTFVMQAFDSNGNLTDTDTILTQSYSQLQVASAAGIRSVTISVTDSGNDVVFVLDDLSATTIPEPSAALLLCAVFALAGGARSRRSCPNSEIPASGRLRSEQLPSG
ncbi:MAG: hypothetical protein ACR2OZ_00015 [Verrucomicrobiales bacterium]